LNAGALLFKQVIDWCYEDYLLFKIMKILSTKNQIPNKSQ